MAINSPLSETKNITLATLLSLAAEWQSQLRSQRLANLAHDTCGPVHNYRLHEQRCLHNSGHMTEHHTTQNTPRADDARS